MRYANESGWAQEPKHLKIDKWYAFLGKETSAEYLGCFDSFEEAAEARKQAERESLWG